jgi:tetratricopeptide (TPR) repeat protein
MSESKDKTLDMLLKCADRALSKLRGLSSQEDVETAKKLVEELRNARAYEPMGQLAEAVSRHDPKDPKNRRLYAQYLIETDRATAAMDVLRPLTQRLPKDHPEAAEAAGLLGRAFKQVFFDAGDKTSKVARDALKQAIDAYGKPYKEDPRNTWHGVNLLALTSRARRLGLRVASDLQPDKLAKDVVGTLEATPKDKRDEWFLPTLAEALIGMGDWDAAENTIRKYAAAEDAKPFLLKSTLRQFTDVLDLETADERGRDLVAILRARFLSLPKAELELGVDEMQRFREQPDPDPGQLEAVLGQIGTRTYRWWKDGLDRALSVAAIRQQLGSRIGSGFAVRAGDFGRDPPDELLVMTNFHVVNEHGVSPGIRSDEAEIVFEAADPARTYMVKEIVWESSSDRHDVALLRLTAPLMGVAPLRLAKVLPVVKSTSRVYVIGHPGGRDLAFSFQDNELLDHEGPPTGRPPVPDVCRVHYRAPTEGGSSGSPVFNGGSWEVIALHHKGGIKGMRRLNGVAGFYAANEGIGIQSIRQAMHP